MSYDCPCCQGNKTVFISFNTDSKRTQVFLKQAVVHVNANPSPSKGLFLQMLFELQYATTGKTGFEFNYMFINAGKGSGVYGWKRAADMEQNVLRDLCSAYSKLAKIVPFP